MKGNKHVHGLSEYYIVPVPTQMRSGIKFLGTVFHSRGQVEPGSAKMFRHQQSILARPLELEQRFTLYEVIFLCVR
jgi:hypothetical protein